MNLKPKGKKREEKNTNKKNIYTRRINNKLQRIRRARKSDEKSFNGYKCSKTKN